MKPSRQVILSKLSFTLIITFLTVILAAAAWAEPTVQPLGGRTCVQLDAGFAEALESLEISLGLIEPAAVRRGRVCFPIVGGGIDLTDLRGEISHTGGLALIQEANGDEVNGDETAEEKVTEDGTTVELINFIIDTTNSATPVLTGLVILDGSLVARLPLFDLDLSEAKIRQKYRRLSIRNVGLTLTEAAAEALNGVFFPDEDPVFEGGLPIGVAKVSAYLLRAYDKGCEL